MTGVQTCALPIYPYTLEAPVASIPVGAVDWVLVDLRDADVPANAVPATRLAGWPKAYFVRNDGQIIDANGNLPDIGSPTVGGGLFIVIRHRNHIDVMSAYPASLSGNTYSYDFTGSLGQAYSLGAGYKEIGTGIFGMVSGDTDADGAVFTSDFNAWAGQFGNDDVYENADLDMDGSVFTSDFNKWAGNFGSDNLIEGGKTLTPMYTSQVPGDIK